MSIRSSQRRAAVCAALALSLTLTAPGVAAAKSTQELDRVSVTSLPGDEWIGSVAVDENDPSRLYCAPVEYVAVEGLQRIYRSTDRGASWTTLPDAVGSVMGSPASLETAGSALYVAGLRPTPVTYLPSIFRTRPGDESYTRLMTVPPPAPYNDRFLGMDVRPNNRRHVFAVTEELTGSGNDPPKLYYSVNGGGSWQAREISAPGVTPEAAECVAASPTGRVLVGGLSFGGGLTPGVGGGVYVSDDLGQTWVRTGCVDRNVTDLAVDPANPSVVYACARKLGGAGRLYKSTDGGDSFAVVNIPGDPSPNTVDVDSRGRVFVGARVIYATPGGVKKTTNEPGGVFQSDDGGNSWAKVGTKTGGQGVVSADLDSAGCYLYTGTAAGMSRYWVPSAEELYGADRYATARRVSRARFPAANSAKTVVIVTGEDFADAVVAGPFAAEYNGVILLCGRDGLDPATMAELERVLPAGSPVAIIGGPDAVPESIVPVLRDKGYRPSRLHGEDRYRTSGAVADLFDGATGCFVLNGEAFPDALSASAPAAELRMPILLVRRDEIPTHAQHLLRTGLQFGTLQDCYIAGDATVVGPTVEARIDSWVDDVVRLGGDTRYDTSLEIAKHFYPVPDTAAGLATGEAFPDGLAGSVLCAHRGGPLLLTRPWELPTETAAYLAKGEPEELTVFGGRAAIHIETRCDLEALW